VVGVIYLVGSLGMLWIVEGNRLRDSQVRRIVLAEVRSHVPLAAPGDRFQLSGLPQPFADMAEAVPLFYSAPVTVELSDRPPRPHSFYFRFDRAQPGRLLEFRRFGSSDRAGP
jgi:hypothetical protein